MPIGLAAAAAIGAGIKGVSSLVKGIKGRRDQKSGEAQMEKALGDIKFTRPEEYEKIMGLLSERKSSINTRREMAEGRIRDTTSSSISGIRQIADSPVAALGAYSGLKQREQEEIADLGVTFEGMRDEATMGMVEGEKMGAGYSEKEDYFDGMYQNMVRANMGASKMEAGRNQAWEGFEGIASAGLDFIGTKYLSGKMNPTKDLGSANLPS